ncbi:MAG: hypothetical protein ACM3PP_04285 [Candidatus Saccharibacteria bacterium]
MSENVIKCPNCQNSNIKKLSEHYLAIAPPPDPQASQKKPWDIQDNEPKTLAEKLAPPEEPAKDFFMAIWAIIPLIPLLNIIFIWMAPMAHLMKRLLTLSGLLLAAAILGYFFHPTSLDPAHYSIGPINVHNAPWAALILILVIYYTGLGVERFQRKYCYEKETYPNWQKSVKAWEALYYCTDCEGAFVPGEPELIKADHIGTHIKSNM